MDFSNAWKLWYCITDQFTMSTCFCHQIQSVGTGAALKSLQVSRNVLRQFSTVKRLSLLQYLFIPLCFHILAEYLYKLILIATLISIDLKAPLLVDHFLPIFSFTATYLFSPPEDGVRTFFSLNHAIKNLLKHCSFALVEDQSCCRVLEL